MKAGEALKILNVTRNTLKRYREKGYLKFKELPTGQFDYDADSVYMLRNRTSERETVIYGRVSTYKQKNDLNNQIKELSDFSVAKGYEISETYKDIASGISFKNRKEFFKMLDKIINGQIKRVIITHKDRLSRVGFDLFQFLFEKYGTEIIVVSDILEPKTDEQELFEEIISLLRAFSMRSYAHHRKEKNMVADLLSNGETEEK